MSVRKHIKKDKKYRDQTDIKGKSSKY